MFHHMPEQLHAMEDSLIASMDMVYEETESLSLLTSVQEVRHTLDGKGGYLSQCLPSATFRYNRIPELENLPLQSMDASSILNLPGTNGWHGKWVDLDGEGIPGILVFRSGNAWYYHRNECSGTPPASEKAFASPFLLSRVPNQRLDIKKSMFEDLDRNGRLYLVNLDSSRGDCGYFSRSEDGNWNQFVPFKNMPSINLSSPAVTRLDLTGSGFLDVLDYIDENGDVKWYPSLGISGFGPQISTGHAEAKPTLEKGDAQERFFTEDMSGDGMMDIIRVRNGDISYWPNLGYGRFGRSVEMQHAPLLDTLDQFSVDRIRVHDVDGSGTADLIYFPVGGTAHLYFNLSGNGWSRRHTITAYPPTTPLSSSTVVDLLGKGTACMCWIGPGCSGGMALSYVNLCGGVKPYLLTSYSNGRGMEADIAYEPSTKYYQEDQKRGTPWQTKLPFPVHCVDQIVVRDPIAQTSYTTRYSYHDGFYDGLEKEFRGFGMVEQHEAEDFAEGAKTEHRQPPIRKKLWFHTGHPSHTAKLPHTFLHQTLSPSHLPDDLTTKDWEQGHRALKGLLLREEVFGDDETQKSDIPYSVSEFNYKVELRQTSVDNSKAVFTVAPREKMTYIYERDPVDPRINHDLTLQVDRFGNVLKSACINYGRRHRTPAQDDRLRQEESLLIYSETEYTNAIDELDYFRTPLFAGSRRYRILASHLPSKLEYDSLTLDDYGFFRKADVIEQRVEPELDILKPQKLLLSESRAYYRSSDLSKVLPYGCTERLSVPERTFRLVFTERFLCELFVRNTQALLYDDSEQLHQFLRYVWPKYERSHVHLLQPCSLYFSPPLSLPLICQWRCAEWTNRSSGYVDLQLDGKWWAPSPQVWYSTDRRAELEQAWKNFYIPLAYEDPLGNLTQEELDDLRLLKIRSGT